MQFKEEEKQVSYPPTGVSPLRAPCDHYYHGHPISPGQQMALNQQIPMQPIPMQPGQQYYFLHPQISGYMPPQSLPPPPQALPPPLQALPPPPQTLPPPPPPYLPVPQTSVPYMSTTYVPYAQTQANTFASTTTTAPQPISKEGREYVFTMESGQTYRAQPTTTVTTTTTATSPIKAPPPDKRKLLRKPPNTGHVERASTSYKGHKINVAGMARVKREKNRMVLPLDKVPDLFNATPYFMGEFGTHGQEVHMAANLCVPLDPCDRRWPNPRYIASRVYEMDPEFRSQHPRYPCRKRVCLWRERLFCLGRHGCAPNSNTSNKKHKNCTVEIVCTIWADVPDMMEISYEGEHGPHHKPPLAAEIAERKLTYQLDEWIKEQLAVNPLTTPTQIHIAATTTLKNRFSINGQVPTLQKIVNRIGYLRKRTHLNQTDCEVLTKLLEDPEIADLVLYPKKKEDYPSPTKKNWHIVFASESMLDTLDSAGRTICGLDSCFKFTKYRMPFWAVVAEDSHHNAAPGAFILGNREKASILADGLRVVADHVPNGGWNPNWMIDKDSKEFKAIKEDLADLFTNEVFLCHFHGVRTWKKQLIAKVKDPKLRLQLLFHILFIQRATTFTSLVGRSIVMRKFCAKIPGATDFWKYFEENWLNSKWRTTWCDVYRPHRWGLFNTNNMTETTFRKLGHLFFQNKLRMSISRLVMCLTKIVVPYYAEVKIQKLQGRIKVKASYQEKVEAEQQQNAKLLYEQGLVTSCKCKCPSLAKCKCGYHDDLYKCHSQRDHAITYYVNLYCRTCTCMYFMHTGRLCKHLMAAVLLREAEGQDDNDLLLVADEATEQNAPLERGQTTSVTATIPSTLPLEATTALTIGQKVVQDLAHELPVTPAVTTLLGVLQTLFNQLPTQAGTPPTNATPTNPRANAAPTNPRANTAPTTTNTTTGAKEKTPFSPEHAGRPQRIVPPSFQFPTHRKRGPKKKHTLDGIDRQHPPTKNYDNVVDVVAKRGIKNLQVAVQWSTPNTANTWEPADNVLSIPRIRKLYDDMIAKNEELSKQRRKEQRKAYQQKRKTNQQLNPQHPEKVSSKRRHQNPNTEVPNAELPNAEVPNTETPNAETPNAETPNAETPNAEALHVEVPGVASSIVNEVHKAPAPIVSPQLLSSPTQPEEESVSKCVESPHARPKRATKRKEPSSPIPTQSKRRSTPPSKKKKGARSTPPSKKTAPTPPGKKEASTGDKHPLSERPYSLAPSMIQEMRDNPNIELVAVTDLVKCVEYDRNKVAKYGSNPRAAVQALWKVLQEEGVNREVILVYSKRDHKVYAIEGNTKIAACKPHPNQIKYLPTRVVAVDTITPRKTGVEAEKTLPRTASTHYAPSAIGFATARVELNN